ncbi:hypothetical protein RYX36_034458 [Vicia faba]
MFLDNTCGVSKLAHTVPSSNNIQRRYLIILMLYKLLQAWRICRAFSKFKDDLLLDKIAINHFSRI